MTGVCFVMQNCLLAQTRLKLTKRSLLFFFFFLSTIADQSGIGMFFKTGVKNIMKSLRQNKVFFTGLAEH